MKGPRTLFEYKTKLAQEDLIRLIRAFNDDNSNFSIPLLRVKVTSNKNQDPILGSSFNFLSKLYSKNPDGSTGIEDGPIFGDLTITKIDNDSSIIKCTCITSEYLWALKYFFMMEKWLFEDSEKIILSNLLEKKRERGPSVNTLIRYDLFKKLKKDHPEWTQTKLALEATDTLRESLNAFDVQNAYRAMGVKWRKGSRTR